MSDWHTLDSAWEFVQEKLAEGVKKKEIVPLLNEAGFRTLKGKEWTYQTMLLEQRRRGEGRKAPKGEGAEKDISKAASKAAPKAKVAKKPKKLKVVERKSNSSDESASSSETLGVSLSSLALEIQNLLENKSFNDTLSAVLDDKQSLGNIAMALNELRRFDPKGRPWHEISLSYHVANELLDNLDDGDFPKGSLADIVGKSRAEYVKEPSEYEKKSEDMWLMIVEELSKGTKKKDLYEVLNAAGYVTMRGKAWSYQTLMHELKRHPERLEAVKVQEKPSLSFAVSTEGESFDPVDLLRSMIKEQLLPQLKGLKNESGKAYNCENLAWALLKRDLKV